MRAGPVCGKLKVKRKKHQESFLGVTFYGLGGGPKISFAEAPLLYAGFKAGFFASLYGSRSWAEDFAELVTMHSITQRLGQPYIITLDGPGGLTVIEPMKSKKVFERAAMVVAGQENISNAGIEVRLRKTAAGQQRPVPLTGKSEKGN